MALALLMPLKRVDPFVIRVDNATGVVDVVPVYAGRSTPEEAVTRYFLTHYLSVCERFNLPRPKATTRNAAPFIRPSATRLGTRCGPPPIPRPP